MHALATLLLIAGNTLAWAGDPDLSMVFVRDAKGRPFRGAYAPHVTDQAWLSRRNRPAWTVELHFTVSREYPYDEGERGR
ncbi:MAG: hypothetical protein KDC03_12160, partial [Flavobacteriales bacterium]|nr:hypothetical protein [Flavobacteriales bacterium]